MSTMRELKLLMTNTDGAEFSPEEIALIRDDDKVISSAPEGAKAAEHIAARVKARGVIYDYRLMLISIMEQPVAPGAGFNRQELKELETLLDKLDSAEGRSDVLISEQEYKLLAGRISQHRFPRYSKAVIKFTDTVIDDCHDVPIAKAVTAEQ